jgi:hypothetical protein
MPGGSAANGLRAMGEGRAMRRSYRLLILVVLVGVLFSPLWFEKPFEPSRSFVQRFDTLLVPTAAAAVIAPTVVREVSSVPQPQFDAARLLMVGTMLFGLAAIVRKAI